MINKRLLLLYRQKQHLPRVDFSQVRPLTGEDIVTGLILVFDAAELRDRVPFDAVLDGEPFLCGEKLMMAVSALPLPGTGGCEISQDAGMTIFAT